MCHFKYAQRQWPSLAGSWIQITSLSLERPSPCVKSDRSPRGQILPRSGLWIHGGIWLRMWVNLVPLCWCSPELAVATRSITVYVVRPLSVHPSDRRCVLRAVRGITSKNPKSRFPLKHEVLMTSGRQQGVLCSRCHHCRESCGTLCALPMGLPLNIQNVHSL